MLNCKQFASQSVYQHGLSVLSSYQSILDHFETGFELPGFRLPDWFSAQKESLVANQHHIDKVANYLLYHDCGKPFCQTEEAGVAHFPNHAEISRQVYLAATGDELVSNLIGWDMVLHTATAEQLDQFLGVWKPQDACTLLLAAFSEIHSNAFATSGIDSTSFKIKWKQLDRRGKRLMNHYFPKGQA